MEITPYFQSLVSCLTPATIFAGVIFLPDSNRRRSFCPVARTLTCVPPISIVRTFIRSFSCGFGAKGTAGPTFKQFFRDGHDALRFEAEFVLKLLERRRSSERLHTNDAASSTNISLPAKGRGLLDRNARLYIRRQDAVAILLRLMLEDVP